MKTNTEMAKIAFRYVGSIAALFILLNGKMEAQTRIDDKPTMQITYVQDESNYLVFKVSVSNTSNKRSGACTTNQLLFHASMNKETSWAIPCAWSR